MATAKTTEKKKRTMKMFQTGSHWKETIGSSLRSLQPQLDEHQQALVVVWRGPVAVGGILCSLVIVNYDSLNRFVWFLREVVSSRDVVLLGVTVVQCVLGVVACYWISVDLLWNRIVQPKIRQRLNDRLNAVVLDELLREWFDPSIPSFIGDCFTFCMGNSVLYALPTTLQQRAAMLQSVGLFHYNNNNAHEEEEVEDVFNVKAQLLLTEPGSIKQLLPPKWKQWLVMENRNDETTTTSSSFVTNTLWQPRPPLPNNNYHNNNNNANLSTNSSHSSSDTSTHEQQIEEGHVLVQGLLSEDGDSSAPIRMAPAYSAPVAGAPGTATTSAAVVFAPPPSNQKTPMQITLDILGDVYLQSLRQRSEQLWQPLQKVLVVAATALNKKRSPSLSLAPPSLNTSLKLVVAASTTALALQLRFSRRARQIVWTVLQASISVGAVSTCMAGMASLQLLALKQQEKDNLLQRIDRINEIRQHQQRHHHHICHHHHHQTERLLAVENGNRAQEEKEHYRKTSNHETGASSPLKNTSATQSTIASTAALAATTSTTSSMVPSSVVTKKTPVPFCWAKLLTTSNLKEYCRRAIQAAVSSKGWQSISAFLLFQWLEHQRRQQVLQAQARMPVVLQNHHPGRIRRGSSSSSISVISLLVKLGIRLGTSATGVTAATYWLQRLASSKMTAKQTRQEDSDDNDNYNTKKTLSKWKQRIREILFLYLSRASVSKKYHATISCFLFLALELISRTRQRLPPVQLLQPQQKRNPYLIHQQQLLQSQSTNNY